MDDGLDDIPGSEETLTCYSELYASRARVYAPRSVDELRRVFAHARARGRRVTMRAGGHSFDRQSLGDDLVVSMVRFDAIEIFAAERRMRVGPGATWGAILARLQPLGLVPAVTVTTEHATAGGTLSGDCLSRFSPAYGKEGKWIASFELLTTDGELLVCTPPREGVAGERARWTPGERAFAGVIGGLGYLGAVVAIDYRVLDVGQTNGKIGVHTVVHKFASFASLADVLVPTAQKTYEEESDPRDPTKHDALYSALYTADDGEAKALFFTSRFTTSPDRKRMAVSEPKLAIRPLVEWIMRSPSISDFLWPIYYRFVYEEGAEYIDDLEGFTFFMDGNVRAKALAKRFGASLKTLQQTFVVPFDADAGDWGTGRDALVRWLELAHAHMLARGLHPTLTDVLFLPQDARFLLSASAGLAGFAVSYAFETSNEDRLARARATFTELADILHADFGGRVYLVKNVCARPETIAAMYGDNARAFFSLKRELDPRRILRNDFFESNFPEAAYGAAAEEEPLEARQESAE